MPAGKGDYERYVGVGVCLVGLALIAAGCGGGGGVPSTGGGGDERLPGAWEIADVEVTAAQIYDVLELDEDGKWGYWDPHGEEPPASGTWGATSTKIKFRVTEGEAPEGLAGEWKYKITEGGSLDMVMERSYEGAHLKVSLEKLEPPG